MLKVYILQGLGNPGLELRHRRILPTLARAPYCTDLYAPAPAFIGPRRARTGFMSETSSHHATAPYGPRSSLSAR